MVNEKAAMIVKSALLHLQINGWCVVKDIIPKDLFPSTVGN